jgi:hypothetical protein
VSVTLVFQTRVLQSRKAKAGWVLKALQERASGFISVLFFQIHFSKTNPAQAKPERQK